MDSLTCTEHWSEPTDRCAAFSLGFWEGRPRREAQDASTCEMAFRCLVVSATHYRLSLLLLDDSMYHGRRKAGRSSGKQRSTRKSKIQSLKFAQTGSRRSGGCPRESCPVRNSRARVHPQQSLARRGMTRHGTEGLHTSYLLADVNRRAPMFSSSSPPPPSPLLSLWKWRRRWQVRSFEIPTCTDISTCAAHQFKSTCSPSLAEQCVGCGMYAGQRSTREEQRHLQSPSPIEA